MSETTLTASAAQEASPNSKTEAGAEGSASPGKPEQPSLDGMQMPETERRALIEAIVYVAEEPLTPQQIADGLALPLEQVQADLQALVEEFRKPQHGIEVRGIAGGYKMFTKAEHHEAVRKFVHSLRPKLKLSLPALETLAVIAYKQPITIPEIQAIRGVKAAGVIHTLLNHKLITTAGRKKVIGRPMMYKTTKEFLVQFGLSDLSELPNLKELEELSRAALSESEGDTPDRDEDQSESAPQQAAGKESARDAADQPAEGENYASKEL